MEGKSHLMYQRLRTARLAWPASYIGEEKRPKALDAVGRG